MNKITIKVPTGVRFISDVPEIKTTYNIEIPHWEESLEACIKELNA